MQLKLVTLGLKCLLFTVITTGLLLLVNCKPKLNGSKCNVHRTGTFVMKGVNDYKVYRTPKQQIEVDEASNDTFTFHLTWKDSCTYILMLEKSTSDNTPLPLNDRMLVEIIDAGAYQYSCNVTYKNDLKIVEMEKVGNLPDNL